MAGAAIPTNGEKKERTFHNKMLGQTQTLNGTDRRSAFGMSSGDPSPKRYL